MSRKKERAGATAAPGEALYRDFIRETLTPEAAERLAGSIIAFGSELYLCPDVSLKGLKVVRAGLDLGEVKKDRFAPAHALALFLKAEDVRQCVPLSADQKETAAFLHGESIPCEVSLSGWALVTVDGYPLGWGKASRGILKNHYPKGLRKQY